MSLLCQRCTVTLQNWSDSPASQVWLWYMFERSCCFSKTSILQNLQTCRSTRNHLVLYYLPPCTRLKDCSICSLTFITDVNTFWATKRTKRKKKTQQFYYFHYYCCYCCKLNTNIHFMYIILNRLWVNITKYVCLRAH